MIEFPLLGILVQVLSHAVKKAAKLNILFTARRLKARPSACAASQLTHLAWENVTTDVTRGGPVCSDRHGLYVDVCIISITQTSMRPAKATHCVGG